MVSKNNHDWAESPHRSATTGALAETGKTGNARDIARIEEQSIAQSTDIELHSNSDC
jgi:hypothetical protein